MHGGRHLAQPPVRAHRQARLTFPHPAAAETPRRDKPDVFQQVRLPDRNTSSHEQIGSFLKIVSRPRSLAPVTSSDSRSLRWADVGGIPSATRCRFPKEVPFSSFPRTNAGVHELLTRIPVLMVPVLPKSDSRRRGTRRPPSAPAVT